MTDDARAVLARRVMRAWAGVFALGGVASLLVAAWLVLAGGGDAWPARLGQALPPLVTGAGGLWVASRLLRRTQRSST